MNQAFRIGVLTSLVSAAAVVTARAAEEQPPKAYVILVGVNDYADKQIKPRKHAEADAKALYDLFVDKKYVGAEKDHVKLLLGTEDAARSSGPATKDNILKALRSAASKAEKNDLLVFAFFGNGAPLGDRACLFGSDATFKDRARNAVTTDDLEKELGHLKSERFVALVDAHFKGFDPAAEKVGEVKPDALARAFLGKSATNDVPAPGRAFCLASAVNRSSLDLEEQGVFAKALLDGLKGSADREGYEPDGAVTAEELLQHLEKQVSELAKAHGSTKEEKEQAPLAFGSRANHFTIANNPAVIEKVQQRLEKFARIVKDKKLAEAIDAEGRKLLSGMPRLRIQHDLRRAYQKLVDGGLSPEDFQKDREKCVADIDRGRRDAATYSRNVMQGVKTLHDGYVKELNTGDMVAWAVEGLYLRAKEKTTPDLKQRLAAAKKLKPADLLVLLADSRERLGKRPDLGNNKDVDHSLQSLVTHLDRHTNYIDNKTVEEFRHLMTGNFTGIGVKIDKDKARDELRIVTPIKDSPAYKAGLKAGDIITKIIRELDEKGNKLDKPEVIATKGLPIGDLIAKVKGKPGTDIKLIVERAGVEKPLELAVARAIVAEETVMGVKRKDTDDWDFLIDPASRIAYVRLTQFSEHSAADLKRSLAELTKDGGIKGLVFDLRGNPGGLLTSAVEICRMFVDDGMIVTIKPRVGKPYSFTGEHKTQYVNFPMVCLVNGGSASASEIVSACLQDHRRAIVIGERSYGKGSVQNIVDFKPTGGQMKLTTATFWRPNGKNLNKASTKGTQAEDWGVIPSKGFLVKQSDQERIALRLHQHEVEVIYRHDVPAKEIKSVKDAVVESALDYLRGQIAIASKAHTKKAG